MGDYLTRAVTVPFRGPPTRGPVMNLCESGRLEQNLGQRLSRVPRGAASRSTAVSQRGLCNVLRHGVRRGQSERDSRLHSPGPATPPSQSGACSRERVHTGTWLGC